MEQRTPKWYSSRRLIVAGSAVALVGLVSAAVLLTGNNPIGGDGPGAATTPAKSLTAPGKPPVTICGNAQALNGPATAPTGAVPVSTTQNLQDLTAQHPAGTTFYLAAGTHRLAGGEFLQVIPKEGNRYVGAPGAILDGGKQNRYAFTGYAPNVMISHLTIQNFGAPKGNNDEGVVNHNSATGWTIEGNTIKNNAGAGLMIGSRNVVRGNCLRDNGQYGFNAYNPNAVNGITVERNEITGNNTDDWENLRPACGCTGGGKFWTVTGAAVRGNWIHDNHGPGLWADTNNAGFTVEDNYISGNYAEGLIYETSYNALIRRNSFIRNGLGKGPENEGFPAPALYISESGADKRVPGQYGQILEVTGNVFTDNWSGVILWENADRFAGSPANTSTGSGTLVNPKVATIKTCNAQNIAKQPYLSDCRWKTQNVRVHDNTFNLNPDKLGDKCASNAGCGYNGIFSNWGTFPDWSPYQARTIEDAITFKQANRFYSNTYSGPWNFIVHEQGNSVNWAAWQGAPYGQDEDSVIKVSGER
ncbi:right-handed parallel beta-helix repeat-containing protein [Kribbella albertanoniae]|uniref:Right-handed parallel beta-helix repeat-containing protein n=1 Tax=Kribbella albertanoniae TaxID=1266829 RepID=A0A4R4PX94_9ACTN|nr:right-handed parallel beta-helix repeat-containing protein [Kribbella albertanoniae]TDC27118.1 right-handed parallel beta-helix repeat-containing protein [Kribbella albertanoniae]